MPRLPIRLRLTAAFALAMAVVLAATAVLLYLRLGAELERTIDDGLRSRARDVTTLVDRTGSLDDVSSETGFVQLLGQNGDVIDATPQVRGRTLLTRAELARAANGPIFVDGSIDGDDPARLLALPVTADGRRVVVVVGTSAEGRAEALESLLGQLLVAAPIALLLGLASRLRVGGRGAPPSRVDATPRGRDHRLRAGEPTAGPRRERRDRTARGDVERHAGAPRARPGARTELRRRREPRAQDSPCAPAGGARPRASARTNPRGARARAQVGGRRERPAVATRGRSARPGAR